METPEIKKQIKEIRKFLVQERVPIALQEKDTILKFLSGCKNKKDETKRKMKNFYEIRKTSPELFQGRDPHLKNLETLLNLGAFFPLPVKPDEGHTLVLVKAGANDPKVTPMTDVFKVGVMSVDLLMETDDGITKNGVSVIVDLKGVGLHHAMQMTPTLIKKMVHLWQDCYPIRINGIDFVNAPRGVDVVLNIFRQFLKENIKKRLRTHGSQLESLHSVVDRRLLPEEYGGSLGPELNFIQGWKKKVQDYRQWFLNDRILN